MLTAFEFLGRIVQADNRGNVERAGNDCRVGGAAAQIRRNAEHELPVHRRRIGWRQIVGDKNVWLGSGEHWFRPLTLQVSNNAACHILHIDRAFAQIRIVDFTQSLGVIARHFLKDPFDVAALRFEPAQNFVD